MICVVISQDVFPVDKILREIKHNDISLAEFDQ